MTKKEAAIKMRRAVKICTQIKIGDAIEDTGTVTHVDQPDLSKWDGDERYYPQTGYFGSIHYKSDSGLHSADPHLVKKKNGRWEVM